MTTLQSRCPTGCGRPVESGKLMCRRCWALVPGFIQREVYDTFRKWSRKLDDDEARQAYKNARERALAAIV